MARGKRCPNCSHFTIFTSVSGGLECSDCGYVLVLLPHSRRVCASMCGGVQTYFKGFDDRGRLLDDDEKEILGTWECLQCGKRDFELREEEHEPTIPREKTVSPIIKVGAN